MLDIAPEWVLAEHGGPYVFDAEDYRRRVKWGEAAGKAADALCVSGDHLRDWTPHRVAVEPVLQSARPGDEIAVRLTLSESGRSDPGATVVFRGRGLFADQTFAFDAGRRQTRDVKMKLAATATPGRAVVLGSHYRPQWTGTDRLYFAVDVLPR